MLDALHDEPRIRVIATRHEGGAAFMAAAAAHFTGRPQVCMGTRMVGAANLAIGIHAAQQDSAPVIALIGQVASAFRHREAFQEAELDQVFGPLTKWAVEPTAASDLGAVTLQAARRAVSGRPGPVVIALREDLLNAEVPPLEASPVEGARAAGDLSRCADVLVAIRAAAQPVMLLGGGILAAGATDACVRLAEREGLPVICTWRRPDAFPNDHPLYLGQTGNGAPPSVLRRLLASDLIVAIGTRLNEIATYGYRVPGPGTKLVHIDVAPEGLGDQRRADIACIADAGLFLEALLVASGADPLDPARLAANDARHSSDRDRWLAETETSSVGERPGFVDQRVVAHHVRALLPADAIVTTDAGNFSGWIVRYLRSQGPGTFIGSTSGAMGYAVPAAIAAKLERPDRPVVAFSGDGGFLMTGSEIETAVREKAPFVGIVLDNRRYNTIRMHQEREHPGRPIATSLGGVDFGGFARSLGGVGLTVRDEADIPMALREALATERPTIIHMSIDPDQVSVADHDADD